MNRAQYQILSKMRSNLSKAKNAYRDAHKAVEATSDGESPNELWEKRAEAYGYLRGLEIGLRYLREFNLKGCNK